MRIASTVLDLIGNTPLVRLNRVTEGLSAQVVAKVEYVNPGGSVKDRIAVRIVDAAEASGDLRPGDQGEAAPVWTVVVWVGALLTALLLLAGGVLFVLPEGARTKALGRFGGFGNRLLARLRVRRPGS